MSDLHVLLAGVDHYDPQRIPGAGLISDLQGCVRDVERMETFVRHGPLAVPAERVRKVVSPASRPGRPRPATEALPTYRNLVREIEALAERARPGDQVLIHYSGHGVSLPTAVPKTKGPTGRDECLVPCNAGATREEGGGFLRDVELHALLLRLADQGLRVTLVLDCCHSGGVTRAVERGRVRGLGHLALAPGPPGPLGSWDDLGALWPDPPEASAKETFRHVEGVSAWFPQPEGCVLLAACLPTEYAREYPFDDGAWSGALTHFFLDAVGDLGPRPTYRWLHHRLLGRIRGLFEHQTPVLEGDGGVTFLGRERWPARRGVPVLERARDGRVLLGAGRAQGLGRGARLEVRADGDDGECLAELEILAARATTSWARASGQGTSPRTLDAGDLAVVLDPGADARRYRIGTFVRAGDGLVHRSTLAGLEDAVASGSRPLLAPPEAEAEADLLVEVMPGGVWRILDPSGEPLPHQGEAIAAEEPEGLDRLLDRLDHLARYRAVEDLDNPGTSSLFGRVQAELFTLRGTEYGEDRADWQDWQGWQDPEIWQDPEARVPVDAGAVPTDTPLCLLVRNDSRRDVNLAVLDLQPDWGISRAHPNRYEGDFVILRAGDELPIPLRACLPEWMDEGRDRLKVIAATGPLDTTHLELDALGESIGYRRFRKLRGPGEDQRPDDGTGLRTRLLNPSRSGSPFRTVEAVTTVSDDWAVVTVELGVVKRGSAPTKGASEPDLVDPPWTATG